MSATTLEYKVGTSLEVELVNIQVLKYLALSNQEALQKTAQQNKLVAKSDLVSGVYEGGLKVWECSFDLVDYIYLNP